jgi:hypothetical protein
VIAGHDAVDLSDLRASERDALITEMSERWLMTMAGHAIAQGIGPYEAVA